MEHLINRLNKTASNIWGQITDLNDLCDVLDGKEITIPAGKHLLRKFSGRKGRLRYVQFDDFGGCIQALVDLFYLDGS